MVKVRDIMTSPVVSVQPGTLVEAALELMIEKSISGLPVVDEKNGLVGMISEFDTLCLAFESADDYWPIEPVAMLMNTEVETIDEAASLEQLAHLFQSRGVRRLPVTRDGQMVGIVSRRDLAKAVRDRRQELMKLPIGIETRRSPLVYGG